MAVGGSASSHEKDFDIIQSLAARLMGRPPHATTRQVCPPTSSSAPRSIPAASTSSRTSKSSSSPVQSVPAQNESLSTTSFLVQTTESTPSSAQGGTSPGVSQSLQGNTRALAEARAFASSATRGRSRLHRGDGPKRERVLSSPRPPAVPRAMLPSDTDSPSRGAIQHVPVSVVNSFPAASIPSGASNLHDRPQIKLTSEPPPTPATAVHGLSSAKGWDLFSSSATPQAKQIDKSPKEVAKEQLTHAHPSTAPSVTEHDALNPFQSRTTDVVKTLRSSRPTPPPPHLRASVTVAGISSESNSPRLILAREGDLGVSEELPAVLPTSHDVLGGSNSNSDRINAPYLRITGNDESKFDKQRKLLSTSRIDTDERSCKQIDHLTKGNEAIADQNPEPSREREQAIQSPSTPKPVQSSKINAAIKPEPPKAAVFNEEIAVSDDILQNLNAIKLQLQIVMKSIDHLEKENVETQNKLQGLFQAEERRRLLGTDAAKAPFGLEVKCPNRKSCNVQVHAGLKIYEMVRRVCAKDNITLHVSSKPRVTINGNETGHGMTLGEVGVSQDTDAEVELSYNA